MNPLRIIAACTAAAAVIALSPAPSQADDRRSDRGRDLGTRSLAAVLGGDGRAFDRNPLDFDVLEEAVYAVLGAKPDSPVGVLADGTTALTAFLPTDQAFRNLVNQVAGHQRRTEAQVFAAAATLGIDTIESVLLYHVVPGATVDYRTALRSDGAQLATALGAPVEVDVRRVWFLRYVKLVDADTDDRNAIILLPDVNRGNRQIGHGITEVLRPVNLP